MFSGALTLTDLNDFIRPSQACIKPVEGGSSSQGAPEPGGAHTQIRVDSSGDYYEVSNHKSERPNSRTKLQTAEISLADCLACSGCITSAETVLVTMQSHKEVFAFLSSNPPPGSSGHHLPVLSISPQSLASLAASISTASHPVSVQIVLNRVRSFCQRRLGFPHVFDTTFARHLALLEHGREFDERKTSRGDNKSALPMLASACPGWICYAEKTHAEMLPFISRTKSPQQVMGTLIKQWMASKWCRSPDEIYHVSVMPCYDKKLEASRQEFYDDVYKTRDVDCVITTGEFELMLQQQGCDLTARVDGEESPRPNYIVDDLALPDLVVHPGTSSGSYLHSLMSFVSTSPGNRDRTLRLKTRAIRSADYEEYTLEDTATGEVVFKGAKCYGFKNIQNVVRKVGKENGTHGLRGSAVQARPRRKVNGQIVQEHGYDFVEIMACPSGCVNGGGQIRLSGKVLGDRARNVEDPRGQAPEDAAQIDDATPEAGTISDAAFRLESKDWIKRVEAAYWGNPESESHQSPSQWVKSSIDVDALVARVLAEMCLPSATSTTAGIGDGGQHALPPRHESLLLSMDTQTESRRRDMFRTTYQKVESEVVGLTATW